MISLIVAVAENGVIGRDGGLPWHLPADLKRFRQLTMGHHLIMGRKTFASLNRALPGRTSIVLSRRDLELPAGVLHAQDWETACRLSAADPEVFVIGGAEVYATALPHAQRLYLTQVHAAVTGDVYFPPYDRSAWKLVEALDQAPDDRHLVPYTFYTFERLHSPAGTEA